MTVKLSFTFETESDALAFLSRNSPQVAPSTPATGPAGEAPKKRGRPASAPVEPSASGAPAAALPTPPAAPPALTKDDFRAFCRDAAVKIGKDAVKAINGTSIETLDPALYAEKKAAIEKAVSEQL